MQNSSTLTTVLGALLFCACQAPAPPTPAAPESAPAAPEPAAAAPAVSAEKHPDEVHLGDLVQLTAGGENAEAYWSFDGTRLIYQAHEGEGCDQIYVRAAHDPKATPQLVSTGQG